MGRISSAELSEWIAFSQFEPFGIEREDLRFAMLACIIANANRSHKQRPFKISDFILKFGPQEEMTDEQIKKTLMGLAVRKKGKGK